MPKGIFPRTIEHRKKISEAQKISMIGNKNGRGNRGKHWNEVARQNYLRAFKGRIISLEHRRKISDSLKGEKASNWKGGVSNQNHIIRGSLEYRLWREGVFRRDGYRCVLCNGGGYLEADHIRSFAYFPELRFKLDNGRTLCLVCHKKTFNYLKDCAEAKSQI